MPESNAELARRGFEAVAAGDLEAVRRLLAPDVSWHGGDPSAPGACRDSDEVIEFIRGARDRVGELVDVIAAGDRVVVVLRPPGESRPRANLVTFRDGKVVEMVSHETPEAALAAAYS